MRLKDLTGMKINMLTIIKKAPSKNRRVYWLCQCECGNYKEILSQNIREGKAYSCGCSRKKMKKKISKYGNYNKRIYRIWRTMNSRCYNVNDKEYCHYGSRNINICNKWLGVDGYKNFEKWSLKNGYQDNLSIDRINNDKGYKPSNCRWVSVRENNLNRRGIILIDYNGEKICLKDYCKINNISYRTATKKYEKGIKIWQK